MKTETQPPASIPNPADDLSVSKDIYELMTFLLAIPVLAGLMFTPAYYEPFGSNPVPYLLYIVPLGLLSFWWLRSSRGFWQPRRALMLTVGASLFFSLLWIREAYDVRPVPPLAVGFGVGIFWTLLCLASELSDASVSRPWYLLVFWPREVVTAALVLAMIIAWNAAGSDPLPALTASIAAGTVAVLSVVAVHLLPRRHLPFVMLLFVMTAAFVTFQVALSNYLDDQAGDAEPVATILLVAVAVVIIYLSRYMLKSGPHLGDLE